MLFLGGPNRPKICVGRTKPDFKDRDHADKLLVGNANRLVHVADGEDLVDLSVAELAHYLHLHLDKDHPVVHSVVNTMPKMATEKWLLTAP